MPDRSRQANTLPVLLIALSVVMLFLILSLATSTAAAQSNATGTPEPTSEFSLNLAPSPEAATGTPDPGQIPSLTGVGGQASNASVIIRSGPGLGYPIISSLKQGSWIDIVGWNGWAEGRTCSPVFKHDLDMWVQVQAGEGRGWIARCALNIRGKVTDLPIVTASGERILQR